MAIASEEHGREPDRFSLAAPATEYDRSTSRVHAARAGSVPVLRRVPVDLMRGGIPLGPDVEYA